MFNNNLTKLCLEFIPVGHWMSTLLLQYIDGCLCLLPHSTLNIQCERFLKQFHEIAIIVTASNHPEGILHADE